MLNPYDYDDAEALAESVADIVEPLRDLIVRAHATDDPASLVTGGRT
jgi:hypothetical protein